MLQTENLLQFKQAQSLSYKAFNDSWFTAADQTVWAVEVGIV